MANHKHVLILVAVAERAKISETPWDIIEFKHHGEWVKCSRMPLLLQSEEYRIVEPMIMVNGVKCPAPLSVEPENGTHVFSPEPVFENHINRFQSHQYSCGSRHHKWLFENGLLYATPENACSRANAMLRFEPC